MVIYISEFVFSEQFDCFVAEAYAGDVLFGVFVDPNLRTIQIRSPKGGDPAAVKEALGECADMLMNQIAEQLGWEEV